MTKETQLQDAASEASQDQPGFEQADRVKTNFVKANGEWLEDVPKLGQPITVKLTGYVAKVGRESIEGGDASRTRDFATIKVIGVEVLD